MWSDGYFNWFVGFFAVLNRFKYKNTYFLPNAPYLDTVRRIVTVCIALDDFTNES